MSYPDRKDEVNSSREHRVEVELCSMRVEWKQQQSGWSIRRMIGRKVDNAFRKTRTGLSGFFVTEGAVWDCHCATKMYPWPHMYCRLVVQSRDTTLR